MRHAGVREARQNLSTLLSFVRDGHEVLITDRGQPVARLVAPLPLSSRPFPARRRFRAAMPVLRPPVSATLAGAVAAGWRAPRELREGPVYLDGGALAALYLPDPWSGRLEKRFAGRRDLTVSELSVTEVVAGFALRIAEVRGAARIGARLHAALLGDLESGCFRRVESSPATHQSAQRLALSMSARAPLRPAQALHLALAMTAGVATLSTFDPALGRAAESAGLRVVPEERRAR